MPFAPLLVGVCAAAASAQTASDFTDPVTARDLLNQVLPVSAEYDAGTQYMIVDIFDVTVPGAAYGRSGAGEVAESSGGGDVPGGQTAPPITAYLQSLGESTGEAVRLMVSSDTRRRFNGEGVVLEALLVDEEAQAALEADITRLAAASPLTRVLNAYCLEFLKGPPTIDQMFRVADPQIQALYVPAANIIKASRSLIGDGLLEPHELDYVHSIKQWALWTAEGGFSYEEFHEAFLAHAEDNFDVAELAWNARIRGLVAESLPERWGYIETILEDAARLPGGVEWRR